jgi:hypothetical protein
MSLRCSRSRRVAIAAALAAAFVGQACGSEERQVVVRPADDVVVMSAEEVADLRKPVETVAETATTSVGAVDSGDGDSGEGDSAAPADTAAASETIPLVQDDRPPELRLFEAFDEFRSCLAADGYEIEGNLQDPNNPAYQDADYANAVSTCAARSDIVNVLQEVQATRSSLTPEEVEQRNEIFLELRDCLVSKGWTVETSTDQNGLLSPTQFVNADGELDTRDINKCLSEAGVEG